MNLKEIQLLVKLLSTSNVDVLEIEDGDFHLKIKKNAMNFVGNQGAPSFVPSGNVALPAANPLDAEATNVESDSSPVAAAPSSTVEVKSPMIGTFYRSSAPDKPSFANIGDEIKVGQTICIVEAMKLFNEIESEVAGRIVKILVDDATPVEYDQALFLVEPI